MESKVQTRIHCLTDGYPTWSYAESNSKEKEQGHAQGQGQTNGQGQGQNSAHTEVSAMALSPNKRFLAIAERFVDVMWVRIG